MPARTAYERDKRNGVARVMVRLPKPDFERMRRSQKRHGTYAPTMNALIRRGIELACNELDAKETT